MTPVNPRARPVTVTAVARTFLKRMRGKSDEDRERIKAAIQQMQDDLNHPSLRVRRVEGQKGVFEARASDALRISFSFTNGDSIRLRVNCSHDEVYRTR